MSTNYYCTVECDDGQSSLDEERICGDAFYVFCMERWNISQEKLNICINCCYIKEVATTDIQKDVEAVNNVEATSVYLSEATINNMNMKGLKVEFKSGRILQGRKKVELQDRLIHAIKYKLPIGDFV